MATETKHHVSYDTGVEHLTTACPYLDVSHTQYGMWNARSGADWATNVVRGSHIWRRLTTHMSEVMRLAHVSSVYNVDTNIDELDNQNRRVQRGI